jgi:hypothetical protein
LRGYGPIGPSLRHSQDEHSWWYRLRGQVTHDEFPRSVHSQDYAL